MRSASFNARRNGSGRARWLRNLAVCVLAALPVWVYAQKQPAADAPDAIIELWEQDWTLNADGATVYHEKQQVRLNNDRAYGEYGDPRITYNEDTDQLEIITARTQRPDGSFRELPDYAHVIVSPDATAGWPAYAGIRQHLLVMSGLEPGCLTELEYKITSKPGTRPYLAGDVRVDHKYPVREHRFTVTTPKGTKVASAVSGYRPEHRADEGAATSTEMWSFKDLPAAISEPQARPWTVRCPRLVFSTGGDGATWLNARLAELDTAAKDSDLIKKLAQEWTKDQTDATDKLRALQEKLAGSFNFIDFAVAWRPLALRPAPDVLQSNYGLPKESAAVLLALARAAGLPAGPGLLLDEDTWREDAPQESMVAAYVVVLPENGTGSLWDAHAGRLVRDGHWAGHRVISIVNGVPQESGLAAFTSADESRVLVRGKVSIKDDGNLTGEISVRTTGLFVSPESVRTLDAQKSRLTALLGRVIPDVQIESLSVKTLTVGELEAEAKIKSGSPLKKVDGLFALKLAQDGPFLADVPLPLARSTRTLPVRLAGPFDETIALKVEWPAKWSVAAQPDALAAARTDHALVEQQVTSAEHELNIERHTRVEAGELPAAEFLKLREPVNEIRSEHARTLLLKP